MLERALGRALGEAPAESAGAWLFNVPGSRRTVRAELSTNWLSFHRHLRVPGRPIDAGLVRSTLRTNGRLGGLGRIVASDAGRDFGIDLPTDGLPWDSDAELEAIVRAAVGALQASVQASRSGASPAAVDDSLRETIEANLDVAGWPAQVSDTGALDVPLDVPGFYAAASLGACGQSAIRFRTPIFGEQYVTAPRACRDAAAVLLWLVASRFRMVKPTLTQSGLAVEAAAPTTFTDSAALAHICAALSAALQQFFAAGRALVADEALAASYLELSGFLGAV